MPLADHGLALSVAAIGIRDESTSSTSCSVVRPVKTSTPATITGTLARSSSSTVSATLPPAPPARAVDARRILRWHAEARHLDEIARHLDVRGPAVRAARSERDRSGEGDRGIVEHGGEAGDALEDLPLKRERAEAMMDQRILVLLANARRAADDDDRR